LPLCLVKGNVKRHQNTGETSLRSAEKARDKILDQYAAQKNDVVFKKASLGEVVKMYLEDRRIHFIDCVESFKKCRQVFEYASTYKTERQCFPEYIRTTLGRDPEVWEFTDDPQWIKGWLNSLKLGGLSDKTLNDKRDILSGFFQYAESLKYISRNPVNKLNVPRQKVDTKKTNDKFIPRTMEENEKIRNYLKKLDHKLAIYEIWVMQELTGMRVSEITHTLVRDVDYKHNQIRVGDKTMIVYKMRKPVVIEYQTKTKREWFVDIHPKLAAILEQHTKGRKADELLFPNTQGGIIKTDYLAKLYKEAMEDLGVTNRRKPNHGNRHWYASHGIEAGVKDKVIQENLGHTTDVMTGRYRHLSAEYRQKEIGKLRI